MANRIIVDRIDGISHIFSDNGSNTLKAHGTAVMEYTVHEKVTEVIQDELPKVLTEQDVIEYLEINNGKEEPLQIIKINDYLDDK